MFLPHRYAIDASEDDFSTDLVIFAKALRTDQQINQLLDTIVASIKSQNSKSPDEPLVRNDQNKDISRLFLNQTI